MIATRHRVLATAALLLGMLHASDAWAGLTSPGPLAKAHAKLDDKCDKCHSSGKRVSAPKCLDCHKRLGQRIAAGAGLHGRAYRGKKCGHCHVEHIGRNSHLVRWPGKDRNKLDHRKTGWALEGGHRGVRCGKCHSQRTRTGYTTYLRASSACKSCHKDEHKGRFKAKCQSCHNVRKWKQVKLVEFDHDQTRYKLKGKHKPVACKKCHGEPARYKIPFDSCKTCHKDPHKGRLKGTCESCHTEAGWKEIGRFRRRHPGLSLGGGHRRVKCERCHDRGNMKVPSKGRRCVSCHRPIHKAKFGRRCNRCHRNVRWLGVRERISRPAHKKTAYPLRLKHAKVACAKCHPRSKPRRKRYRGIAFNACLACHADKHAGEFTARKGGECAQCHTERGFTPTTFGVAAHRTTQFALAGGHTAVPCSRCHKQRRPRVDFRVAKRACADCHANPHGTQFATEMNAGGCATCHNTARWDNPKINHSVWPLTGRHKQAGCADCHGGKKGTRQPAAAGGAKAVANGAVYRGTPRECKGCHTDAHAGQFRLTKPFRGCADCHNTTKFPITRFDHTRKTTYKLVGAHKRVTCNKCHRQERLRNGTTAVRYRLFYRACSDCHANPHRK